MTNVATPPPVVCAQVAGPLQLWVGTGAVGAAEFLGWSRNGARIEEIPFNAPIFSDDYGGDQGPPSDYQLMGGQHRISFELSKYSPTVLAKLEAFYNQAILSSTSATAQVGMLMTCLPLTTRLLLLAGTPTVFTYCRNYPTALIINPIEFEPVGSQATMPRLSFIANYRAGETPYNQTVTA